MPQKVTQLTELTTLDPDDILYIIDDPGVTPVSRKITAENVAKAGFGLASTELLEVRAVLHEETLGAAGIFDVSSISQSYTHLEFVLSVRTDVSANADSWNIYFNNDTTDSNYANQVNQGVNATIISAENNATPTAGRAAGDTAPTYEYALNKVIIPLYSTTNLLKKTFCECAVAASGTATYLLTRMVIWDGGGGAAINRITIRPDDYPTNEFVAGSYLQITGIKASG